MENFNWRKPGTILGITTGVLLLGLLIYGITCIHFVDKHELGFVFDRFNGSVAAVQHSGWVVRNSIRYDVNTIDLRPYQVSITANWTISSRILNAKLVKFNPDGLNTFIAWHGRKAGNNVENLKEILKCYAFDLEEGRDCPFLTVVSQLAPSQGGGPEPAK